MHERREIHTKFWPENLIECYYLAVIGAGSAILLMWELTGFIKHSSPCA
jgi:hypothetical protein